VSRVFIVAVTIRKIQRPSGVKYLAIIKDRLGRSITSKTFTRKTDARTWADRVKADQDTLIALGGKGSKITFTKLLDEYFADWHGKSFSSQQARALFWAKHFEKYRLIEIDADKIRGVLSTLRSQNCKIGSGRGKNAGKTREINKTLSNTTVNRYRCVLSSIMSFAFKQEYIASNPVNKTASLPMSKGRVRYLTSAERERLLTACRASEWDKLYLIVLLAMTTGMRRGELLKLRWRDIDFENNLAFLEDTKNGDPRVCPIPLAAMTELRPFREIGSALVFASILKPEQPYDFTKPWKKALESAMLENFVFHSLRHDFCSQLAMGGANLHEIAELAGHKDLQTTKRYTHLSTKHKQDLAERIMGKVLGM
jgi:integrase